LTDASGPEAALAAHGGIRTELADWFPLVQALGVPVPRTTLIPTNGIELFSMFDNEGNETIEAAKAAILAAASEVGFPAFLRTGLTSAKHEWKHTCRLDSPEAVPRALYSLTEAQEMYWLPPVETFVVREMLAVTPLFHAFEDMPIVNERRYFVTDGKVVDRQNYWPLSAIDGHLDRLSEHPVVDDWRERLIAAAQESPEEVAELTALSEQVSSVMPGSWSVDWLQTTSGWVFIDAAWAETSYVMPAQDREALGSSLAPVFAS